MLAVVTKDKVFRYKWKLQPQYPLGFNGVKVLRRCVRQSAVL